PGRLRAVQPRDLRQTGRGSQGIPRDPPRHRSRTDHDRVQGHGRAGLRQHDPGRAGQEPARSDRRHLRLGIVSLDPPSKDRKPPPAEGAFFAPASRESEPVPVQTAGLTVVSLAAAIALLYYGRLFFITVIFALFLS